MPPKSENQPPFAAVAQVTVNANDPLSCQIDAVRRGLDAVAKQAEWTGKAVNIGQLVPVLLHYLREIAKKQEDIERRLAQAEDYLEQNSDEPFEPLTKQVCDPPVARIVQSE